MPEDLNDLNSKNLKSKYLIGEFSRLVGLGIHTLRYYEHEGII